MRTESITSVTGSLTWITESDRTPKENSVNTKDRIIQALEEAKGEYISGERLAELFDLSRNAIWKGINELKKDGYPIASVRNKGYMLPVSSDMISKAGIALALKERVGEKDAEELLERLYVYETLDSTNTQAKRELLIDAFSVTHQTTIVARTQSSGRGHRGSAFDSPDGGIYFSMILDPKKVRKPELVSGTVADMVTDMFEELCGIRVQKKKDHSLYKGNRKVCGILTEAVSDLETGVYSSLIVGIGIRAEALAGPAAEVPTKNRVIAALMDKLSNL